MLIRLRWRLILSLLPGAFGLSAQQTPLNTFYRSNWQMVNPAAIDRSLYLGNYHNSWGFNSGVRQQWIGLEGAPRTYFVSIEHCPDIGTSNTGTHFGGTLIRDETDALSSTAFYANYSFFFTVPNKRGHVIHLGFSPGIVTSNLDVSKIRLPDQKMVDPVLGLYDKRLLFDVSLGAMYRIRRDFYFGVALPQLVGFKFSNDSSRLNRRQHIYLHTGWFIEAGESSYNGDGPPNQGVWLIEPSIWLRYVPGVSYSTTLPGFPFSIDVNLRVYHQRAVWAGLGYGTNGMANAEFGVSKKIGDKNRLQLGVACGFPFFRKRLTLGPSAEVTAAYWWW